MKQMSEIYFYLDDKNKYDNFRYFFVYENRINENFLGGLSCTSSRYVTLNAVNLILTKSLQAIFGL